MQTLSLGDIKFLAQESGLVMELGDPAGRRVSLSMRDVAELQEFLRLHLRRERRVGFRVRLAPLSDRVRQAFRVDLRIGRERIQARPVDLSLTGALVGAPGVAVRLGMEFPVDLALDDMHCSLTGVVVRIDEDLVALHFVESLKNGELSPPEVLLGIYRRLETEWLRSRID